ncbi:hypothetical protein U1Q18_040420, partial [Sarracenia purpurea var. burkii]
VQKNGAIAHVPPPRPKRKAAHPYPQKAPKSGLSHDDNENKLAEDFIKILSTLICYFFKNLAVLAPLQASMAYPSSLNSLEPGYSSWDDTPTLINTPSGGTMPSQDEYNLHGVEGMLKFFLLYL